MTSKFEKPKLKIAVSGAAAIDCCAAGAAELTKEIGREIARQGCVLVTGATTGIPYYAAMGAKEAGGVSIGFSPAASEAEHVKTYKLPLDFFDMVVYTGFDYAGRNLLMTRAADGVLIVCGRMGTLNEFTIAFEDQKPIGVLEGSGGTADKVWELSTGPHRGVKKMVFSRNPRKLVLSLIALIKKDKKPNRLPLSKDLEKR
jgi:uncharacterized protein (TIGR00725 family)